MMQFLLHLTEEKKDMKNQLMRLLFQLLLVDPKH